MCLSFYWCCDCSLMMWNCIIVGLSVVWCFVDSCYVAGTVVCCWIASVSGNYYVEGLWPVLDYYYVDFVDTLLCCYVVVVVALLSCGWTGRRIAYHYYVGLDWQYYYVCLNWQFLCWIEWSSRWPWVGKLLRWEFCSNGTTCICICQSRILRRIIMSCVVVCICSWWLLGDNSI